MRIPQRGLGVTINERRIRAVRNAHAPESQTSHDLACACSPTCVPSSTARFVQALRELDDSVRHQRIAVMRIPQSPSPSTSAAPSGTRTHPRVRPRMTWHALAVPTCAPSSTARFVQALRQLDDSVRRQRIAVMRIPRRGLGVATNERRTRAVRNAHASESQTSHNLRCACSPDMRSIVNCSFRSSSSTTGRFCTSSAHCGHADSPKRIGSHHQRAPHTRRPERARIREPDLA